MLTVDKELVLVDKVHLDFRALKEVYEPFRISFLVLKSYEVKDKLVVDLRVVKVLNFCENNVEEVVSFKLFNIMI